MSYTIRSLQDIKIAVNSLNVLLDSVMAEQFPLGDLLLEMRNVGLAQGGLTRLAESSAIERQALQKILSPHGNPTLISFINIVRALGLTIKFEKENNYVSQRSLRSFASSNEILLSEWHSVFNNDLTPDDVAIASQRRVWWQCKNNTDHAWIASVAARSNNNRNCPYCARQKLAPSNSFAATHPHLIDEWNDVQNLSLKPSDVMAGSNKKVWWKCKQNHEWLAMIRSRALGFGCPVCSGGSRTNKNNENESALGC
ncbi:MAG: zinc-ribbon domain-containing protein [Candidatus Babeliales bacterium]|jgi:DNA-binding phage protein